MRRYVLGFAFDNGWRNVLLVWRTKSDFQYGKMNGLGGKICEGETPCQAMRREFLEETGGRAGDLSFTPFGRLRGDDTVRAPSMFEVWLFHGRYPGEFSPRLNDVVVEGEGVLQVVPREDLANLPVLPNLRYLVPMALNHARGLDSAKFFDVSETSLSPEVGSVGGGS